MASNSVVWASSHKCDFCQGECGPVLYDGATKYGPWAVMCEACWKRHGVRILGPGFGQKYELKGGKYAKTEG